MKKSKNIWLWVLFCKEKIQVPEHSYMVGIISKRKGLK